MKKANERIIKNALARLRATKDEVIRAGMYGLLEDAVQIALEAHDERHQSHIELGDTYGWMLLHNGKIEEISVVATNDNIGKATQRLRHLAIRKAFSKGWVGVVMAGLEPANYFSVIYEMGMLDYSFQITKENFSQYFKKL
jgi:hypothetical protein